MASLINYFFGPLPQDFCLLFLVYSACYLLAIFFCLFLMLMSLFVKKRNLEMFMVALFALGQSVVFYYQMRVTYNMCLNSIK